MVGVFGFLSEYSLQQSAYRLKDLLNDAHFNDYPFVAVNDINNLYGAYKLFTTSKLPVIIGMKLDIIHLEKETSILCYAKNDEGYKNLIMLSTMVQFKENNRLDFIDLIKNQKGLYFITSGYYSDIDSNILYNEQETIKRLKSYKENLNDFSIGLSLQSFRQEIEIAPRLKELSQRLDIMLLPVNYMAYKKSDKATYDAVIRIQDRDNKRPGDMDLSFLTKREIEKRYFDYDEVFKNLSKVLKKFTFKYKKPVFELPSLRRFRDSKEALKKISYSGLLAKIKFKDDREKENYYKRLNHELDVINELGFNNYFLIVYDFVKYAKDKGILVGPGRGSSAGSLVSYCLNITDVDPLEHGLLFERFLNKDRVSMPDIDLDFPDDRREEVIDYIKNTYGKEHVLSINTFSRFSTKAAIRDVCRIKGLSPSETNIMSRKLASAVTLDKEAREIMSLANSFDGLPRQTSTHAAGIVLGKEDLRYIIPLQPGPKLFQSQFDHDDLTSMGLLKIDLLGIRNLSIIMGVVELIREKDKRFDLEKINFSDSKTFDLLQQADTLGIFQLESAGMRSVLRKLKPTDFNDIVALLALYRPGPLANIDTYIERRKGKKFTYLDPILEPILKETYGIILYQEQIMTIAQKFAGLTLNEADMLRVGIGKKDKEILMQEKERFVKQSIKNNRTLEQAENIYNYIVKFADYGFNKSHSVAYSIVAYQMAYLKANYYKEFMAVYLSTTGTDASFITIMNQLKQRNISVLPPSIQESTLKFIVKEEGLLFPLTGIKNIGNKTAKEIIDERNENGKYLNYEQMKTRLKSIVTDRVLDGLIFSGALDSFNETRQTLYDEKDHSTGLYESLLKDVKQVNKKEFDNSFLATKEKEVLGFNLMTSPIPELETLIEKFKGVSLSNLGRRKNVITAAKVFRINEITTKKGDKMAFVTFTDQIIYLDVTIFNDAYKKYKDMLEVDKILVIELVYQDYQGGSWYLKEIKK